MCTRKKIKFDSLLLATFLATIFYASTYPYIHKHIISSVSDTFISLNQIANCLSVIIFSKLWNTRGDKLYNEFVKLCVCESLLGITLAIAVTQTHNWLCYYIADTWIFCLVSRNIICGGIRLKNIRYTGNAREKFDNNQNIASAVATLIGSVIALVLKLDMETMIWIATLGNCTDNLIYATAYVNTKRGIENGRNKG